MATRQDDVIPDFLRMDDAIGSDPANANKTGNWHGWPTKDLNPVTLMDDAGRTVRIRTPVMDLEGLITPTDLHYTVQHFDVPPVVPTDQWELKVHGQVKNELTLNFAASPDAASARSWNAPAATPPSSSISKTRAPSPPAPKNA